MSEDKYNDTRAVSVDIEENKEVDVKWCLEQVKAEQKT